MIDLTKLKAGAKIRLLKGGEILEIKGSYMSGTGLVLTSKPKPGRVDSRNVPVEDIESVLE